MEQSKEKVYEITTNDGAVTTLPESLCNQSLLLKEFMGESENFPALTKVNKEELNKIVEFMKLFAEKAMPDIPKPLSTVNIDSIVGEKYGKFIDIDVDRLCILLDKANFMDVRPLVDLCAAKIASYVQGRPLAEVKKNFGIHREFTPEEIAEVEKTYAFLKETA